MIVQDEIADYLKSTGKFKKVTDISELKGGLLNHAYFAKTDLGPVVIKQYGQSIKDMPDFKLPSGRYETEKNAYLLFGKKLDQKINPQIYHFDDDKETIVMEYLDDTRRVDKIITSIPPEKFKGLGKLLAEIANTTYKKDELLPMFNGTEFQELKYQHRYYLHIKNPLLFKVRDEIMKQFRTNRVAVMHGDPRFNNMFFIEGKFYFIDYEGAYYADVSLDIAYLLAETLIYFYENPQGHYGEMAENLWTGFQENLKVPINQDELEQRIVKHICFALIDKVKGEVIKNDYLFVKDRLKAENLFEKIILNDNIKTLKQLLDLNY